MSQKLEVGTAKVPFILSVGEIGNINAGFWRPEILFCRFQLVNGQLGPLVAFPNPGRPCQVKVAYVCSSCGTKLEAFLNFF
jgi:hypothetical protein